MKLQVVLEPSEEGGYTVFVPSLPGCISEGDDISDALFNIQEAIDAVVGDAHPTKKLYQLLLNTPIGI